ncbi:MAG: hypothetical protein R2764_13030 [Bacteroidales bacterium]
MAVAHGDTIVIQQNIWQMVDVEFRDYDHGIVTACGRMELS